jgi:hypothetical protein
LKANQAPRVVLRATHESALNYCSLADLKRFAVDLAQSAQLKELERTKACQRRRRELTI